MSPDGGRRERAVALAERLARFDTLVEVGVGHRPEVAARLAQRGRVVTATDRRERPVPDGVAFVVDDVTDPDPAVYAGADAVYGLNLPPELHRPALAVARRVDAALAFTTLGGDPPTVDARPETIAVTVSGEETPSGETLFWARE